MDLFFLLLPLTFHYQETPTAEASTAGQTPPPSSSSISDQMDPQHASNTLVHLRKLGMAQPVPESCNTSGFYSHFYESFIKVDHIQRGRISCTVPVKPAISNDYGTLHGGAVGSLVELLSIGCARTVVAEDRELFLGEINISYLSGVPTNVADVFTKTISQFTGAISIPGCQSWIA